MADVSQKSNEISTGLNGLRCQEHMDWTLIGVVAILVLYVVTIALWKPWAVGYGTEKGKNLARKEDLESKILFEVRAVAQVQKEIEAKLAGDLWLRQAGWNQKRDSFITFLNQIEQARECCSAFQSLLALEDKLKATRGEAWYLEQTSRRWRRLNKANREMNHCVTIFGLFLETAAGVKVYEAVIAYNEIKNEGTVETMERRRGALMCVSQAVLDVARQELGIKAIVPQAALTDSADLS